MNAAVPSPARNTVNAPPSRYQADRGSGQPRLSASAGPMADHGVSGTLPLPSRPALRLARPISRPVSAEPAAASPPSAFIRRFSIRSATTSSRHVPHLAMCTRTRSRSSSVKLAVDQRGQPLAEVGHG